MAEAKTYKNPWVRRFYTNREFQFWTWQFIGWSGLSLVSFFSLNLWYNQPEISYLAHNLVQSILGAIFALPLRYVFRRIWSLDPGKRLVYAVIAVLLIALGWSAVRLQVFMLMTGERGLWSDFGGWFFPSIFIFLCWTALYHGIKYFQLSVIEHEKLILEVGLKREEQLKRLQAESAAREAELKMLRYQINPHFLFNTLNAISSLVQCGETERANQMIGQLGGFLRYSLTDELEDKVALSREVEALKMYLSIEQTRFTDRLQTSFEISSEAENQLIPSLILQPLVENSIKYAVAPSEDGAKISIKADIIDDFLVLQVRDSGSAVTAKKDSGLGVGLRNTRERLKAIYEDQAYLDHYLDDEGGYDVKIRIPLEGRIPYGSHQEEELIDE